MKEKIVNLFLILIEAFVLRFLYLDLFATNSGGCLECGDPYQAASFGLFVFLVLYGLLIYLQSGITKRIFNENFV